MPRQPRPAAVKINASLACIALLLLAGCSDPKAVVIGDFRAFGREGVATIAALTDDERALFLRFSAEHEWNFSNPDPGLIDADMPRELKGKTVGQVLDIARLYYAKKDDTIAKREAAAGLKFSQKRERKEYSGAPEGERANVAGAGSSRVMQAIEGEVLRGGPRGEVRLFEDHQEQAALIRGAPPKTMNGQFRYYLAEVKMLQPQESGCKTALLAVKLAVENLHGTATSSIYGRFTFTESATGSGAGQTVGSPYRADLIGPFSNKQGGITYVTAFLEQGNPIADSMQWSRIAAIPASRLVVRFAPEVFYYPNGEQYTHRLGRGPAAREVLPCGGADRGTKAQAARQAAISAGAGTS